MINENNREGESLIATYKTHPWRWYILATFSILAFSSGLSWLIYAPIVKWTASFYNVSIGTANFLSFIIYIGAGVGAPFGMFALDSLSLREAMWIGAILNFLGNIVRTVSSYLPSYIPYLQFGVAMAGQCLLGLAQPYFLFGPTKVAAVWFAEGERVVANTIASLSPILGSGVAMLISPGIVDSNEQLPLLLEVAAVPASIGLIMTVLGVCKKRPTYPPSPSAESGLKTWTGIKTLVRNWQFLWLLVTFSITAGIYSIAITLLTQFICPYGYTEWFSGILGSIMIFGGLLGAFIFGFVVDRTKWFDKAIKISLVAASFGLIIFLEIFRIPNQPVLMATSLTVIAFFVMPIYPLISELAIEVSYPVAEGTCNGFLSTGNQIFSAILIFLAPYMAQTPDSRYKQISQCDLTGSTNTTLNASSQGLDYIYLFYFASGVMALIACANIIVFRPKCARLEAERRKA